MLNLVRADLFRIVRSKSIYLIFLVMIVMAVLSAALKCPGVIGKSNISTNDDLNKISEEIEEPDNVKEIFEMINNNKSDEAKKKLPLEVIGSNMNLYYLIVFIVYAVLTADFSNKCIKNTLSSVTNRKMYFVSKMAVIFGIAILLIFMNTFVFFGINYILNGTRYSCSLLTALKATAVQLPLLLGLTSVLILIVYMTRSGVLYNSIAIAGVLLFQLIITLTYEITKLKIFDTFMRNYEIQEALYKLAYAPEQKHTIICTIAGLGMILASSLIGYNVFKRSEIK